MDSLPQTPKDEPAYLTEAIALDEYAAAMHELGVNLWQRDIIDHDTLHKLDRTSVAHARYLEHCLNCVRNNFPQPVFDVRHFLIKFGVERDPRPIPPDFGNAYTAEERLE